jgi:hypothetical protein
MSAWVAVAATPVLFYAGELWEHAPAAAGVLTAAALLAPRSDFGPQTSGFGPAGGENRGTNHPVSIPGAAEARSRKPEARSPTPGPAWRFFAAGAAVAVATLFREEAFAALPALLVARAVARRGLKTPPHIGGVVGPSLKTPLHTVAVVGRGLQTPALLAVLGAAAVFAASVPLNVILHGSPLPLHLTNEIEKSHSYLAVRGEVIREMLLPSRGATAYAIVIACVFIAGFATRRADAARRIEVAHACVAALVMVVAGVPVWQWVFNGSPLIEGVSMGSVAYTWIFALALIYYAQLPGSPVRGEVARFIVVGALLITAAALAIVPSSGGAQWSPRYLLSAAPLLAVLAPAAIWTSRTLPDRRARRARVAVCAVLALSAVVQIEGMWALGKTKVRNARLTSTTAAHVAPGAVVITAVAWFPEITATLLPSRRIMFVPAAEQVGEIASRAAARGFRALAIVTELGGYPAPSEIVPPGGGCRFVRDGSPEPLGRNLELHRFTCHPVAYLR